ncbi:hypothetical protein Q1695_008568 [Nippostrongylus brasiliensis]|nr:hypothetical protein Q1695_008568 [Nippostrongylus brasiliensis]
MALVMFSDDEDVSRHGAVLDTIHDDIVKRAKTPEPTILFEDKENIERVPYLKFVEKDPICREILAERQRPVGDVWILPMAPPSKCEDEYEFPFDQESPGVQTIKQESPDSAERTPSRGCSAPRTRSNSLSESCTPRIQRRKLLRLQQLLEATEGGPSGHSDDDEAFIPTLSVDDYEALYEEQAELKMRLRPKREVWSAEDDLPLEDVQAIMRIDEATERLNEGLTRVTNHAEIEVRSVEVKKKLPKRRRQVEVGSSQSDSDMDLPLSHFVSARGPRKRKKLSFPSPTTPSAQEAGGSDEDTPSSSVKRRRFLCPRVDYSNMEWD